MLNSTAEVIVHDDLAQIDEPRTATRRAMSLQVQVAPASGPVASYLSDEVSRQGMFLHTARPLDVGSVVKLAFALPRTRMVRADAEVVWNTRQNPGPGRPGRVGMGVRFTKLSREDADALARFFGP